MKRNSGIAKMILIIVVAAVMLLAGLGIFLLKGGKSHKPEKQPTTQMALGEFVVNLADTSEVRYVKVDIVLEVEGEVHASEGEGGEGSHGDPRVRDAIIQVMSGKHFAQLGRPEGKETLKKDIITAVNERMKEDGMKVVNVYFNEFAMQ